MDDGHAARWKGAVCHWCGASRTESPGPDGGPGTLGGLAASAALTAALVLVIGLPTLVLTGADWFLLAAAAALAVLAAGLLRAAAAARRSVCRVCGRRFRG